MGHGPAERAGAPAGARAAGAHGVLRHARRALLVHRPLGGRGGGARPRAGMYAMTVEGLGALAVAEC